MRLGSARVDSEVDSGEEEAEGEVGGAGAELEEVPVVQENISTTTISCTILKRARAAGEVPVVPESISSTTTSCMILRRMVAGAAGAVAEEEEEAVVDEGGEDAKASLLRTGPQTAASAKAALEAANGGLSRSMTSSQLRRKCV